ncbi:M23 family metallopeptidase [Cohaesibacter intestini]|uniref:M23 family metallopeptidase n=1 Tax=Cohaesibacter intestini TaxID=2211145 RepID=UPI0013004EDF|nr:M23 family metallopeptidase [Cohaesibacter intestini]
MLSQSNRREFGRRTEPHRIIIAHGDVVQDFTIRPWIVTSVIIVGLIFSCLYLSATAYLVFRDEIISFSRSEQALAQNAYEDRIAHLRAQLDRVASRQMIDQQVMETHVQNLMRKQADFEAYSSVLEPILNKARKAGMTIRSDLKVPLPKTAPWRAKNKDKQATAPAQSAEMPTKVATASAVDVGFDVGFDSRENISNRFRELAKLGFRSSQSLAKDMTPTGSIQVADTAPLGLKPTSIIDTLEVKEDNTTIVKLADAASRLETEMLDSQAILHNLLNDIRKKTASVEQRIAKLGVKIEKSEQLAVGGPYVPITAELDHDELAEKAEQVTLALDHFMQLKRNVSRLPISHPLPTARLSSRFGVRKDPFLNRMSMHSGVDLAERYGTSIRASGSGVVTRSGRISGYGIMVEVDHGGGVISRYAHMSKALAKKGEKVNKGTILGKVGSSGRSTGPHLHFETRVHGKAVDPYAFLSAGKELRHLI